MSDFCSNASTSHGGTSGKGPLRPSVHRETSWFFSQTRQILKVCHSVSTCEDMLSVQRVTPLIRCLRGRHIATPATEEPQSDGRSNHCAQKERPCLRSTFLCQGGAWYAAHRLTLQQGYTINFKAAVVSENVIASISSSYN